MRQRSPCRAMGRHRDRPPRRTGATPAIHSSVSARWCGVTSHVTGSPARLGAGAPVPARRPWRRASGASERRVRRGRRPRGSPGRERPPSPRPPPASRADPRTVATSPSFASAPSVWVASSGWSTIGSPRAPAYASALRRIPADRTGAPSSEKPTTPASASSPSAASVSPARSAVTAPYIRSSTGDPDDAAAPRTAARTPGSSRAGVVLGMPQTVVNPPCAAAASPDTTVSASSLPGSRRCACRSMNPGATTTPLASTPSPSSPSSHVTASRTPSRTTTSPGPSRPVAGSTTQTRLRSRSVMSSRAGRWTLRPATQRSIEQRTVTNRSTSVASHGTYEGGRRIRARGRPARSSVVSCDATGVRGETCGLRRAGHRLSDSRRRAGTAGPSGWRPRSSPGR